MNSFSPMMAAVEMPLTLFLIYSLYRASSDGSTMRSKSVYK